MSNDTVVNARTASSGVTPTPSLIPSIKLCTDRCSTITPFGCPLEVKEVSLLDVAKEDRQEAIDAWKAADIEAGFDLKKGPLMRLLVLQTGTEECVLVWSHHHILMDGWCLSLILQEFLALYAGRRNGRPAELGPVQSYGHYIEWLGEQDPDEAKGYWREHLKGYTEKAALPKKQGAASVPCNYNAYIESFFSILERDVFRRNEFEHFEEAYFEVDEFMEFYNHRRYHGSLGRMSPAKFHEKYKDSGFPKEMALSL
ncbi:condensation domain-containing protein [Lysinibacillus sphaericus]